MKSDDDNLPSGSQIQGQDIPSPTLSSSSSSSISEVKLWSSNSSSDGSEELNSKAKSLLDLSSPNFNPQLALKCDTLAQVLPDPDASSCANRYLNLQQYAKAVHSPSKTPKKSVPTIQKKTEGDLRCRQTENQKKDEDAAQASTSASAFPIPGRRFLPHQLPVFRPRKEHPNTLTLMQTADGPLYVLKRVMAEKTRIKIWTRSDKGFRGFLTGFLEAFDKHWNIALRDVDEQFVRRKLIKFPILGDNISQHEDESADQKVGMGGNKEDDNRTKEETISSTFIRLKSYLRQNEGTAKKRIGCGDKSILTAKSNNNKTKRSSSSKSITTDATKSKTIYVGDMDPLSLCRTGLAKLSLRDDVHQHSRTSSRKTSTNVMEPDVQCHQRRSVVGGESTSTSSAACSHSPPHVPTIQQNTISRTSLKKKSLTVFKTPYEDSFGFMVVAQTKKYELVERHVGQVLLMGNDIVFIETSGC